MKNFSFNIPVEIVFGRGRISELRGHLSSGFERVMIVSEHTVAKHSNAVNEVQKQLSGLEVCQFLDVEENPSFETIEKGAVIAEQMKCQLIIGVGGGSPMDAAKGIAMRVTNDAYLKELIEMDELPSKPLPVICVPTTSGTGSEVTPFAVFTDRKGKNKCGYGNKDIFPILALLDPALTDTVPESVLINTGLDALTHSIEAYLSTEAFEMNDMIALESIRQVIDNLKKAKEKNEEALDAMAYASMLGGIAITHASTILLHIMAYPLTVYHGIPHGKANAILLPAVMDFLREYSSVKSKIATLDQIFKSVGGIRGFVNDMGISSSLSDHGISESELSTFVKKVIVKGDIKITPAKVTEKEILEIYKAGLRK